MDPVALLTSILAPFFIVGIAFLAFIFVIRGAAKRLSKDGSRGGMSSISFWNIGKSAVVFIHQFLNRGKTDDSAVTKPGADSKSISTQENNPAISKDRPAIAQDKPDSEHQ